MAWIRFEIDYLVDGEKVTEPIKAMNEKHAATLAENKANKDAREVSVQAIRKVK